MLFIYTLLCFHLGYECSQHVNVNKGRPIIGFMHSWTNVPFAKSAIIGQTD